jgi:polyhydroxyalkanoate synthesis regulator phasin
MGYGELRPALDSAGFFYCATEDRAMIRALERRIDKLEAKVDEIVRANQITIWCEQPEKMDPMVDVLIARGKLKEEDRWRCIHWSALKRADELRHDDWIEIMDAREMLRRAEAGACSAPVPL